MVSHLHYLRRSQVLKSNLLVEKTLQMQNEYKNLLSNLMMSLRESISLVALDEINLFWFKNMDLVRLYLSNEFANKDSYTFTASTFLDFDDNEQYPFLLLGTNHILDDPLCKYSEICSQIPDGMASEEFLGQIKKTAEDNLKILKNCNDQIILLPLRLLSQTPKDSLIFKMGEQAFSSLFNGINSLKEFFEKCSSFDDIMRYAREDIGNIVLFSESDDKSLPFELRYNQAKKENSCVIRSEYNEARNFFMMVFGSIQQAVDVIVSCMEYKCIPFIRYPVALNYIVLLEEVMHKLPFISEMRYKMCVANTLYIICDKERLSKFGFKKFITAVKTSDFSKLLFKSLLDHNIKENNFDVNAAAPIIEECLDELYIAIGA